MKKRIAIPVSKAEKRDLQAVDIIKSLEINENEKRDYYWLALIVALLTATVYLTSLRNDFVNWDDQLYVYGNLHIRSLGWSFFQWAIADITTGSWHPLTWISLAIDYAFWGLNPFGYHLTNLILHIINSCIVVFLTANILKIVVDNGYYSNWNNRTIMVAVGVTGTLFGIHPLHVESVAWVAERKDLLYTLFYLMSIVSYIEFARYPEKTVYRFNNNYLLSLLFFFFSLCSKPMAVTLPAVLILFDWYPLKRVLAKADFVKLLLEKLPFVVLSVVVSILTVISQKTAGAVATLEMIPFDDRLLVALHSLVQYMCKVFVPVKLLPLYKYPHNISLIKPEYFIAVFLVSIITISSIYMMKKKPEWFVIWMFFLITIFPVLGFIQTGTQSIADRYMYVPSLAFFLLIGSVVGHLCGVTNTPIALKNFSVVVAILFVLFLTYLTNSQISIWKNSLVLWNHVLSEEVGRTPTAYNNRGLILTQKGEFDKAIEDFTLAISLKADYSEAYVGRGCGFLKKLQLDRAADDFTSAISLKPDYVLAYINRGDTFLKMGKHDDRAIEDSNTAIFLQPDSASAYINRAKAFLNKKQYDNAISDANTAISLSPNSLLAYLHRGDALTEKGEYRRAAEDYSKVRSLNPKFVRADGSSI